MEKIILILTILVLLSCLVSLSAVKVYTKYHSDTGYTVEYPDTWKFLDERASGFEIIPVKAAEGDTLPRIRVDVSKMDKATADLSFDEFNVKMIAQFRNELIASEYINPQVSEPNVIDVSGIPAISTYTRTNYQGVPWRMRQTIVRKGDNIYMMTDLVTRDGYEKWLTDFYVIESGFALE